MNILLLILIVVIIIGLAGFLKVCKPVHIIPQILQVVFVGYLVYSNINISIWGFIALMFPYYFLFLGYREILRDLRYFFGGSKEILFVPKDNNKAENKIKINEEMLRKTYKIIARLLSECTKYTLEKPSFALDGPAMKIGMKNPYTITIFSRELFLHICVLWYIKNLVRKEENTSLKEVKTVFLLSVWKVLNEQNNKCFELLLSDAEKLFFSRVNFILKDETLKKKNHRFLTICNYERYVLEKNNKVEYFMSDHDLPDVISDAAEEEFLEEAYRIEFIQKGLDDIDDIII